MRIDLISENKEWQKYVKIVSIIIGKATNRQRQHRSFLRLMRLDERKLRPAVNEWLAYMVKELRSGLPKMRGKTANAKVKSIADWKAIEERGQEILKPVLFKILNDGGKSIVGASVLKQEQRFDPIGVAAVGWANKHSAELVVEITDETMKAIRAYIQTGVDAGKSVGTISRELRPLVGLTEKNIFAVANYEEWLIVNRPEYSAKRISEMADVYSRRLHRRRADLIARTETSSSLNEGIRQGYEQMGVKNLERVEDPQCCDICDENNGRIYTIGEASGVLPEHPACEGTFVAA